MKEKRKNVASLLFIILLAVMAFVRGPMQNWFILAIIVGCLIWILAKAHLYLGQIMHVKLQAQQSKMKRQAMGYQHQQMLLRYANYRISIYLESFCPGAKWGWCNASPERIVDQGGAAVIRLYNVSNADYAEVTFGCQPGVNNCDAMHIELLAKKETLENDSQSKTQTARSNPVSEPETEAPATEKPETKTTAPPYTPAPQSATKPKTPKADPTTPKPQPAVVPSAEKKFNPAIWYDIQGRKVLEQQVTELDKQGYNGLIIKPDGMICVGSKEVQKGTFPNFPAQAHWLAITQILKDEGMSATVGNRGLCITW